MGEFYIKTEKRGKGGESIDQKKYYMRWGGKKPEQKKKTEKENLPSVREVVSNRLDQPKFVKMENGTLGYGTDEGFDYKDINEDRVVVDTENGVFAVVDGMGSYGNGHQMAEILAGTILKGAEREASFEEIQNSAHKMMQVTVNLDEKLSKEKKEKLLEGGACYLAYKIEGEKLSGAQAGDVRLMILRKGKIAFETADRGLGHIVYNSVSGKKPGEYSPFEFGDLQPGDRIITMSDGITDNVLRNEAWREEFIRNVSRKSIKEAMEYIGTQTEKEMLSKEGKPDNRGVLVHDFYGNENAGRHMTEKQKAQKKSQQEEGKLPKVEIRKKREEEKVVEEGKLAAVKIKLEKVYNKPLSRREFDEAPVQKIGEKRKEEKKYKSTLGDRIWAFKEGLRELFTGKFSRELPPSLRKEK